ncbi:hypothetical protein Pelo_1877 [Pelomyxa schiedti]|nr:hypothetical protein Pelo_1877 [Pelomyxa schiedti]
MLVEPIQVCFEAAALYTIPKSSTNKLDTSFETHLHLHQVLPAGTSNPQFPSWRPNRLGKPPRGSITGANGVARRDKFPNSTTPNANSPPIISFKQIRDLALKRLFFYKRNFDGSERPPTAPHLTVLCSNCNDPKGATETRKLESLELLIPEVNTLNNVPDHQNVTKFCGVALHDETTLLGMSERLRPLDIPQLFPLTTTTTKSREILSMADLLRVMYLDNQQLRGVPPDEVLPMCVREHILRDVAFGLAHSQCPAVVHGEVDVGNVLIISLDPAGSSPWAKEHEPRSIIQGDTLPTTHGDVWNFGILVHNVVAPLSFVNIRSTTTKSLPNRSNPGPRKISTAPASNCATSTTSGFSSVSREKSFSSATPAPELLECGGYNCFEVERFQVATVSESTTSTTAEGEQPQRVALPLWARQVISCCLVAKPSLRPPMKTLLDIWDHITFSG